MDAEHEGTTETQQEHLRQVVQGDPSPAEATLTRLAGVIRLLKPAQLRALLVAVLAGLTPAQREALVAALGGAVSPSDAIPARGRVVPAENLALDEAPAGAQEQGVREAGD